MRMNVMRARFWPRAAAAVVKRDEGLYSTAVDTNGRMDSGGAAACAEYLVTVDFNMSAGQPKFTSRTSSIGSSNLHRSD